VAETRVTCQTCEAKYDEDLSHCPRCIARNRTRSLPVVGLSGTEGLTSRLCRAVGLDPKTIQGFRLTVLGGEFPKLEILTIPEYVQNHEITDPWSEPLADVAVTYELHPTVGAKPHGYTRPPMLVDLDEAIETFDGSPHGDFLINVRNALLATTVTTAEAEAGAKALTDALQTPEVPDAGDR
jgi:hypothetical protein